MSPHRERAIERASQQVNDELEQDVFEKVVEHLVRERGYGSRLARDLRVWRARFTSALYTESNTGGYALGLQTAFQVMSASIVEQAASLPPLLRGRGALPASA